MECESVRRGVVRSCTELYEAFGLAQGITETEEERMRDREGEGETESCLSL